MGRGGTVAIIFLVLFVVLGGLSGWLAYDQYNKVKSIQNDPETGKAGAEVELRKEVGIRADLEEQLKKAKADLEAAREAHDVVFQEQLVAKTAKERAGINAADAVILSETAKNWSTSIQGTETKWNEAPTPEDPSTGTIDQEIAQYTARQEEAAAIQRDRMKAINKAIGELEAALERFNDEVRVEMEALRKRRGHDQNLLNIYKIDIVKLVTREPPVGLPQVGRVISSQPEFNAAVISLGTRHGVKPGMRFEVFQVRRGNRRVHKGYVEIKAAQPEVSSCAILVKEVRLPRCPICNYTAGQPEEQYCPRCTAPGSQQQAQSLLDTKVVIMGEGGTDPIVRGDLLFNPLFGLEPRSYAVSGRSLVERNYASAEAVKEAVEFYGGTVHEQLSAKTDVLIALRGDTAIVEKAEKLGIIILRGFDLFRFLEK